MSVTPARFYELSAFLPEGFSWGDHLQPHHLQEILEAAKAHETSLKVESEEQQIVNSQG